MRRLAWSAWRHLREPRIRFPAGRLARRIARANALPPERFRELQLAELRRFLAWCRRRVPWYRRLFDEISLDTGDGFDMDEFRRIPPLTRAMLRRHFDELRADDPSVRGVRRNHTGGSTGEPVSFLQDDSYAIHSVAADRFFRRTWGLTPWGRTAYVWGHRGDLERRGWRDAAWSWWAGERYLDAFQLDERRAREFVDFLDRWRPEAIFGYASTLVYLARFVPRDARFLRSLRLVRSSAETLDPARRRILEETFGVPVVDFYGSREVNNLAWECPAGGHLHVFSPWRLVELVGPPLDEAGSRQVLVTDLANRAMPLVRYELGDLAVPAEGSCPRGYGSPAIARLRGRVSDLVRTRDGSWIHGEFFTHLFYGCRGIDRFQVRQAADGSLDLLLQGDPGAAARSVEAILARIREATGFEPTPRWVERIEPSPSGKLRFTISELSPVAGEAAGKDPSR